MAGNVDTRTEVIPASGVVQLPNANFLFIVSSTGNVALQLKRQGLRPGAAQENYTGQLAGLQISRTAAWDFASITGVAGVSVTFIYGNVGIRDDATLFNQQIAIISGVTAVALQPSSTFTDTADTAQATATETVIAANLTRRRITIGVPPTAAANEPVRVSFVGGAGRGVVIMPGTNQEFDTTSALHVRNDNTLATGLGTVWYAEEE
jgi:hypothetical protein